MTEPPAVPRPVMGLRDLVLFYVVTGLSIRWVATAATAGPSAIIIWLGAWTCFFLPLALAVVELTSRYPVEGGLYVWARETMGEWAGFLAGWTYWASNLPYFPAILYFTASNALFAFGDGAVQRLDGSAAYFIAFAVTAIVLATALNIVGLGVGRWLHNVGAVGTWVPAGILIVIGAMVLARHGSATPFTAETLRPGLALRDMVFWGALIFALGGSESASFLTSEIRNPRWTLPRALPIAGLLVTVGYILGTAAILVALPPGEVSGLAGIMQAVTRSARRIGWEVVAPWVALLITAGNLGAVGAWLTATARLPFVAGLDRYLPPAFARLHPRWGTPHVALLTQAGLALLFIVLGQAGTTVKGAYDILVNMGIIAYEIPYLFVFASLIRAQALPAPAGAWRIPGGRPVATALGGLGFATTSAAILLSLVPPPDEPRQLLALAKVVGMTAALLGIGAVLFLSGRRRARLAHAGRSAGLAR